MKIDPRSRSRVLLDGADRAAARAYFKAVGFTDRDLARPLIGVAHCWIEITPCNSNHRALAEKVKELAFWDRLFGTAYLPADRKPSGYGLTDVDFPRGYVRQHLFAFRPLADV